MRLTPERLEEIRTKLRREHYANPAVISNLLAHIDALGEDNARLREVLEQVVSIAPSYAAYEAARIARAALDGEETT